MNKLVTKFLGNSKEFPLNHRISNAALILGALLGIQASVSNYMLNLPMITVYTTLGMTVILSILYYFSRVKANFKFPTYTAILINMLIYTPIMWISNGGSSGGFQYYFFVYATFIIAVVKNKKVLKLFISITVIVFIALLFYEYTFPERILGYPSREDKYGDLFIGFIFVLFGVIYLFYTYTELYDRTNLELSFKNTELKKQNIQLFQHQSKIENQNIHITDSIKYAQKIQKAVFPSVDLLKRNTKDYFLLYLPREKIGGDFYYFTKINNCFVTAVADSTGHGVPGGFMSMLGITILEEIIKRKNILNAAEILNKFREEIINSLDQKNIRSTTNDGFDVAICIFDSQTKQLNYAGANLPLILMKQKEIISYSPDNMPVGTYITMKPFKNNYIDISKDDTFYLFTDGVTDQFGGEKDQKFSFHRLKKILTDNSDEPMFIQKEQFKKIFRKWKGKQKRTDDALILGVKLI
ncbi:MAG: SpoIIE family protein phosphatase [Chlorobi bacterium]|nr:SpoIIE family protein phosphatase [Chlorobiota bacterium]